MLIISSYVFYFDESFHDRKILVNENGKFNVMADNSLDSYIGVFWGCKQEELSANTLMLKRFEERQKQRFGLRQEQELKSTIIRPKNYKYGIRSFNKTTMEFYWDLFEVLDAINPIIQINAISKVEYFLRRTFENVTMPFIYSFNEPAFYYTLTKFMITYHNTELLNALYNITDTASLEKFIDLLLFNLRCILDAIYGIERKGQEIIAFEQLYKILSGAELAINIAKKFDFAYFVNFEGLQRLFEEKDIDICKVELVLDQEEKTFVSATQYPFLLVKQDDSKENIHLRLSDLLSGFIGHIMRAIICDENIAEDVVVDVRKIKENDLERKRLLSTEWFNLSEEQFDLYKKLYEVLIVPHQEYWTCMTLSYNDQVMTFFTLIRYISSYKDYDRFKQTSVELHAEYYNNACLIELKRRFNEFWSR